MPSAVHFTPPVAEAAAPSPRWQLELARGFHRLDALLEALDLDPGACGVSAAAARTFRLRVPRSFAARMRRGDPRDPLLLQVLPALAELADVPGYSRDPVGDLASVRARGLLQKYAGRALLITTGACAVHCRYCFRREFPYGDEGLSPAAEDAAVAAIAADRSIREVIFSGGDPLVLSDARLARLMHATADIPHVDRLRIHSRVPIVLPERIDDGLLHLVRSIPKSVVFVVHANHPAEIDAPVRDALARLRGVCISVLNQSVLLRNVNDDEASLAALSEALFGAGVLPYYLHQLDPVRGAAHFAVDDAAALALLAGLRARLPGYLVPRLVRETAGAPAKSPL